MRNRPDALRRRLPARRSSVLRQLDVGEAARSACRRASPRASTCRRLSFCALEAVLRSGAAGTRRAPCASGSTTSTPCSAVDDQQVVLADHVARVVQADDRRDVQAARDDRGVRGDAADVGDEAGELVALEQDHVGGRQVVRDHDQVVLAREACGGCGARACPPSSAFSTRSTTCSMSSRALAQVGVLHLLELRDQLVHLLHQRPLGVAAALADELARRLRERRVVEDHAVQVDEGAELGRRVVGGSALRSAASSCLRARDRGVEADDLAPARRLRRSRSARPRAARWRRGARGRWRCRRTRRRRAARSSRAHSPSPNLSANSFCSAASAASASSPSASMLIDGALARGEHHHAHDALGVDAPAVARRARPRS